MKKNYIATFVVLVLVSQSLNAQSGAGRWSLGVHGGPNMWVNDMNKRKIGVGGDLFIRYGASPLFSIGLMGGYEELKAGQDPTYPVELPFNYYKLRAGHANLVAWIHLAEGGTVTPYVYIGGGVMLYKRVTGLNTHFPDTKFKTSLHVPVGFGIEAAIGPNISFSVDAGARLQDDHTDRFKQKTPDWYGSVKAGLNFYLGASDYDDDDEDGLTNAQESRFGTNPMDPDSDQDGLKDGEEVRRYRTDPLRTDTDTDGISDGDEVLKYRTDPNQTDTDGDGLSDGAEITKYTTDPLKLDTDGDTLTDGDEVLKYNTDPLRIDTDGDGLSDWKEVRSYKTDPLRSDTDGDGLLDGDEVQKYRSDPTRTDTDGGGVGDAAEVAKGTNPADPSDDHGVGQLTIEEAKPTVLPGVNFVTNSAKLLRDSETILERAYNALTANPYLRVEIVGHTDNVGSYDLNQRLSKQRAQSVKRWLVDRGIDAGRLTISGRGPDEPVDTNSTPEGRANNRRIEFRIKK